MTRQRALLLLMVIVFLSAFAYGSAFMRNMEFGRDLNPNFFQWLMFIVFAVPVLTTPIFSVWSDAHGRRPLLLTAMIFQLAGAIVAMSTNNVIVFYITMIITMATNWIMVGSTVYIADLTTSKIRAELFAALGAAGALGQMAGSRFSGRVYLYSPEVVTYTGIAVMLIATLITYFALPESLREENKTKLDWRDANIFGTTKMVFTNGRNVSLLVVSYLLIYFAFQATGAVRFWVLVDEQRREYVNMGQSSDAQFAFTVMVAGLIVLMISAMGRSKTAIVALVITGISAIAYVFVPGPLVRTIVMLPTLGTMAAFIIVALISEKSGPQRYGAIIGGVMSLTTAVSVLGSLNSAWYNHLNEKFPDLTFLTAVVPATFFLLSIIPFILVPKEERA